jgi:cytochrome c peroxidase
MSNGKDRNHNDLPDTNNLLNQISPRERRNRTTVSSFMYQLLRFVKKTSNSFIQLISRFSGNLKKGTSIAVVIVAVVLAGHTVSAQISPPPPLSQVPIPKPKNLGDFVKNEQAAIALGKSLFWDMQLGTDGVQSCASCHFNAGIDTRSKNQINPGLLRVNNPDNTFNTGGGANYQLTAADFPFHKLEDPNKRDSKVVSDNNDITGSQGVFRSDFGDVVPGSDKDKVTPKKDEVFNVQGTNVRQVTSRSTPSTINAVFNFRNFWDGRAQNIFNGVSQFGLRDPNAFILKVNGRRLEDVRVSLDNSSLASQAVGPPLSAFETAAENLPIAPLKVESSDTNDNVKVIDATNGRTIDNNIQEAAPADTTPQNKQENKQLNGSGTDSSRRRPTKRFERVGRKLGKKMLALRPLAKQEVHPEDSVLGNYRRGTSKGLNTTYEDLIKEAFKPEWWNSDIIIRINPKNGNRIFFRRPKKRPLSTIEYTLPEYNFSLFFGLAIQSYESTLVSDQTPFDKGTLNEQQKKGQDLFLSKGCIGCHIGSEFTAASVSNVVKNKRIQRVIPFAPKAIQDTGFFNIGVRPSTDDTGLGGNDDFENPLSEVRLAQKGKFQQLLGEDPPTLNPPLGQPDDIVVADGAFKAPGIRNIELTAPYFHNGGQSTLEQVVDFYSRGGDFGGLPVLNLTPEEKQAMVAFLKGLTDERVRNQQAPFDHPQLFVPNGHPGDQSSVTKDPNVQTTDGTTQATDQLLEIPAVGRSGGKPLPNFLANTSP